MRFAIPHDLPREEVRRRFRDNVGSLADHMPGGVAEVQSGWPSENRMNLSVAAMGQTVTGHVDIEDAQVVFNVTLPPALAFVEPVIQGAIRQQGQKLLENKS